MELEKCPFCGGDAVLESWDRGSPIMHYRIRCAHAGCVVSPLTKWNPDKEYVITEWNHRPKESQLLRDVAELRSYATHSSACFSRDNSLVAHHELRCNCGLDDLWNRTTYAEVEEE